ncbi:hypothetical protein PF010_g12696 [Phytophthora fragariae]|uniref:RNase H type-1 domain-containing protein n=1 Tax=Phytophthora fragariae TaxID=53985 RepID=A0A6G0L213_9STRA|nr:hypothetical protein PF010_g12696 [Phytophthora fragariae]
MRRTPKLKVVKGYYWQARRIADAVAVVTWSVHAREYNFAARAIARVAKTSGRPVEWNAVEFPTAGDKWTAISARVTTDVTHWLTTQHEPSHLRLAVDKV